MYSSNMVFPRTLTIAVTTAALLASLGNGAPVAPMSTVKRGADLGFSFGQEKIHGVNLGGWFVLEPWITPSIFEATPENVLDEYSMAATLGQSEMQSRMQKHWSSWITADDFLEMASHGINMVRIPVGYWSVSPIDGEPYVQGAYEYLDKAIGWAGENGIKVLIDLHGAPGSQNGFDNSGNKGVINWTSGNTIAQTHKALNKIRDDHASNPTVVAIELINEPMAPELDLDTVTQFYYDGCGDLAKSPVCAVFHDAFEGVDAWNEFGSGMSDLMVDTHHYEIFDSGALEMSVDEHIGTACAFGAQMATNNKWTVAGEWCGAMTDCAKWLNGRGIGARYDGTYEGSSYIGSCEGYSTGSVDGLSQEAKQNIGSYIQAQMVAFDKAAGWFWWTWKTEGAPEWDFQQLAKAGIIPSLDSLDTSICGW